jgi:hypothetical protein
MQVLHCSMRCFFYFCQNAISIVATDFFRPAASRLCFNTCPGIKTAGKWPVSSVNGSFWPFSVAFSRIAVQLGPSRRAWMIRQRNDGESSPGRRRWPLAGLSFGCFRRFSGPLAMGKRYSMRKFWQVKYYHFITFERGSYQAYNNRHPLRRLSAPHCTKNVCP